MLSYGEYEIRETIHSYGGFDLLRATSKRTGEPVLLKMPKAVGHENGVAAVLREYDLLRQSRSFGGRSVRIEKLGAVAALVLPDENRIPLRPFAAGQTLSLDAFLLLAVRLASALESLHDDKIVHGGLSPDTLFVQPDDLSIELLNLFYAFRQGAAAAYPAPYGDPDADPVRFPYLAPEQITTAGRQADPRTDLYALGVVLYWLWSGGLPYTASEPASLRHAIVTKAPQPIADRRLGMPQQLADIVGKLLEKDPAMRYQTAYGLRRDLETCKERWKDAGEILPFLLAENDRRKMFRITETLYGRSMEKLQIEQALRWVKLGAVQTLCVTGPGGIGKTALIREIVRQQTTNAVYLSTGRFDRLERDIPYSAIVRVFRDLLRQVYAREMDSSRLSGMKRKFQEKLALNDFLFDETVPELKWFLGEQSAGAKPLSAQDRQVSLHQGVRQFIRILTEERPLFLILDDVHWADPASIQLLASILTDSETQRLLLVCCYRDDEVDSDHPLSALIRKASESGAAMDRLGLTPLGARDFTVWVMETLNCDFRQADRLARLLFGKTAGNPLFFRQLLQSLYEDGDIRYEEGQGWIWNEEAIRELVVPEDLGEFAARRIKLLPEDHRLAAGMAACIGEQFGLAELAEISGCSPEQARGRLKPAIREGMILPANADTREGTVYRFLHDKVRTAAYACLPEEQRLAAHRNAGRMLLKKGERLFSAIYHLNRGKAAAHGAEERLELARLNLEAGNRAKSTAAFEAALQFYDSGIDLISEADRESSFDLIFQLEAGKAESTYLCGRFSDAERLFDLLMSRARHRSDRLIVYRLRMMKAFIQGRYDHTTRIGIEILREFRIRIPSVPSTPWLILQTLRNRKRIRRNMDRIERLSSVSDPEMMTVMELLSLMCTSSALSDRNMHVCLVNLFIRLSMKYGNSSYSPVAYASFAVMIGFALRDYETSCEIGDAALRLADRTGDRSVMGRTYAMHGAVMHHWRYPVRDSKERLAKAARFSLESGDVAYTGYATGMLATVITMFEPLDKQIEWVSPQIKLLKELYPPFGKSLGIFRQFAMNMKGLTEDRFSFSGPDFNESDFLRETLPGTDNDLGLNVYYNLKLRSQYIFGNYREAIRIAELAEALVLPINSIALPNLRFYWALSMTAAWEDSPKREQRFIRRKLGWLLKYLGKLAERCPENFRARHRLVAAEWARIEGNRERAEALYEEAMQAAAASGEVPLQAAAAERAFLYFDRAGELERARRLAQEAFRLYGEWGADAKLRQLAAGNAHLFSSPHDSGESAAVFTAAMAESETENRSGEGADEPAKAQPIPDFRTEYPLGIESSDYNIGNEEDLVRLIHKLGSVTLQYAGASRGALILENEGERFEKACFDADGWVSLDSAKLGDSECLSATIAGFAMSSGEAVLLDHASAEGLFVHDSYVQRRKSKSICCIPVALGNGTGNGALYLENPYMEGVFSCVNLDMLRRLAKQSMYALRLLESFKAEEALQAAKSETDPPGDIEMLTERELEVLRWMAEGLMNDEIAERMGIAIGTVKVHTRNIFSKLNVNRRAKAVLLAHELRLIR